MEQRQAIALLDSAGFAPMHIATVLGVTANSVRIALHRARKASRTSSDADPNANKHQNADD
jgi:DNA-directed RNA polymerase specialized sigma24 family protein